MSGSKRGDVNGYQCDTCGSHTYVVHVDDGVTMALARFHVAARTAR